MLAAGTAALGAGTLGAVLAPQASAEAFTRRSAAVGKRKAWSSGVCADDPAAFGTWRGETVSVLGMFADASVAAQREVYHFVNGAKNPACDVDLSLGGPIEHTWAETAAGAEVPLWKEQAALIRSNWRYRTVYLRFAHEANGTWMPWSVAPKELTAYKASFRKFVQTMRTELRGKNVKIVYAPNFGSWRYTPDAMFPGADVVDVIGVSMYEWTLYDTAAKWKSFAKSSIGPAYWQSFAKRKGRPMALSEWGARSPYFLRSMNTWMRANAGSGAGKFLYDCYLNTTEFRLAGSAASTYRALTWGR